MPTRSERIGQIVETRKSKGKNIENIQIWLRAVQNALSEYRTGLNNNPYLTSDSQKEIVVGLTNAAAEIDNDINTAMAKLQKVSLHFAKDTLSVAVVGLARQGKSTFLQSLTGLGSEQIPSQLSNACTSTQSIILNLPEGEGWADVFYYNLKELMEVLAAYYSLLNWGTPEFYSLQQFRADFGSREEPENITDRATYRILKAYYDNLGTIEANVGAELHKSIRIGLDEISRYVTYYEGESRSENLAVSHVEIHCKFPCEDVGQLAVVDTPGMNANTEDRDRLILERVLNDTADFVLFISIPASTSSTPPETRMFENCKRCMRQMSDKTTLRDRSFYIANQAKVLDDAGNVVQDGTNEQFNEIKLRDFDRHDIPSAKFIRVNAKDVEAVRKGVLDEMVDYLLKNLPEWDELEVKAARDFASQINDRVLKIIRDSRDKLHLNRQLGADDYRKFGECFAAMFPSLKASLQQYVEAHESILVEDDRDEDDLNIIKRNPFVDKIMEIKKGYQAGAEEELSLEYVKDEMQTAGGSGAASYNLLSNLRCYVRDSFSGLEEACRGMVDKAKGELIGIFVRDLSEGGGGFGKVAALRYEQPCQFFEALEQLCHEAIGSTQCKNLAVEFRRLATFELKFSGFIEHKVATSLGLLRGSTYVNKNELPVYDVSTPESIRSGLIERGKQAVDEVVLALCTKSSTEPEEAIFAVIENFVDKTLRSRGMEAEWRDLYEVVRADVWPEQFDPNSEANRNALQVRVLVEKLEKVSSQFAAVR